MAGNAAVSLQHPDYPLYKYGYEDKKCADIVLVFNGQEYPSHKLILAQSGYFYTIFATDNWKKKKVKRHEDGLDRYKVELSGSYSKDEWEMLLKHLYGLCEQYSCDCKRRTAYELIKFYDICDELSFNDGTNHAQMHVESCENSMRDCLLMFSFFERIAHKEITSWLYKSIILLSRDENDYNVLDMVDWENKSHAKFAMLYTSTGLTHKFEYVENSGDERIQIKYVELPNSKCSYDICSVKPKETVQYPVEILYYIYRDFTKQYSNDINPQIDGVKKAYLELDPEKVSLYIELTSESSSKECHLKAIVFNIIFKNTDGLRVLFDLDSHQPTHYEGCGMYNMEYSIKYDRKKCDDIRYRVKIKLPSDVALLNFGFVSMDDDCKMSKSEFIITTKKWLTDVCMWQESSKHK